MTVTVSYQVIADFAGGVVPEAETLSVSISRDVGEIFSDLRAAEAEFTFDNQNGDLSPDRVTGPYSMQLGGQIRIEATTDAGSTYGLFNGFVRTIADNPALGRRQTMIRAMDVAQYLRRSINTGLLIGTNTIEVLSEVMSDAAIPSSMFALDNKLLDIHPFVFMDNISAGSAIKRIVESGAHYSQVDGAGVFQVSNRNVDLQSAVVASYSNFALDMRTALDDRTLMNDVKLRGLLRAPTTDPTTVAGITEQQPTIAGSSSISFFLEYQDPTTLETPLPVNSLSSPLVANSDYVITSSGGVDVTATTSVAVTVFALTAKVDLFNGVGDTATVEQFFLQGYPLLRQPPFSARVSNASSQTKYGKRAFSLSSEMFEDISFADAYADFLDLRFRVPLSEIFISQRNQFPDVVQIDLLDLLHIQESHTAISSNFLVIGIQHQIDFASVGTVHTATYRCRLQQEKIFLILDDATKGKLDDRAIGF